MKVHVFFVFLCPLLSWAQTRTGEARTGGSCSPAVSGSSNQITVTCTGVSKDKADEMVRLMNSILVRQLDPKKVYSELDQIYGAVSDIGAAINPLANAPPEVSARIKVAQRMQQDCSEFSREWTQATMRAQQQSQMKLLDSMTQLRTSDTRTADSDSPAVNAEFANQYAQLLAPKVLAWRSRIEQQASFFISTQDWRNPADDGQMHFICSRARALFKRYSAFHSAEYDIIRDSPALLDTCDSFAGSWTKAQGRQAPSGGSQMPNLRAPIQAANAVNADCLKKYKETIEASLRSWRDESLKKFPDHPRKDYDQVVDVMQLKHGLCGCR